MEITEKNLNDLLALTKKASDAIMEIYNSNTAVVEYKSDNSPLTQADKASHEIIVSGLKSLFPDIPVVSEEGSQEENQILVKQPIFWLVDPIDGTQDFVNRTGEFCIAIALVENNTPTFGFVVAPTLDTIYYGGKLGGSFKKVGNADAQPIHTKWLSPHVVAISRTHLIPETEAYITDHYPDASMQKIGSMLKQMKLAEGEVDIYPAINQPLHLWDAAAGNAIIEGAGGMMTRLNGSPLDYSRADLHVGNFIAKAR
jgi:3'(2'), 5'-bisphosphate nucleotidase